MQGVLRDEHDTDLVVFSGDQVSGYVIANPRETLRKWTEPMRAVNALRLPFASIFGNHDDQAFSIGHTLQYHCAQGLLVVIISACLLFAYRREFSRSVNMTVASVFALGLLVGFSPSNIMRRSLLHYEHASFGQLSFSREGPPGMNGLSNYFLRVSHANQTCLILLLDSGGGRLEETYTDKQIEWIKSVTRNELELGIAFAHIPPVDFRVALMDSVRFSCVGFNHTEAVIPAAQEHLPLMEELGKAGIKALFSGHDHRDSYCCVPRPDILYRPAMCYGRHTGYGGYGNWMRGARVIQLDFSLNGTSVWTWLRMEDGTKRELVKLYPV